MRGIACLILFGRSGGAIGASQKANCVIAAVDNINVLQSPVYVSDSRRAPLRTTQPCPQWIYALAYMIRYSELDDWMPLNRFAILIGDVSLRGLT